VENVGRGRPDCCADYPLDRLWAVHFGWCVFVVCTACAADSVVEALNARSAVKVEPYLDWLFS